MLGAGCQAGSQASQSAAPVEVRGGLQAAADDQVV